MIISQLNAVRDAQSVERILIANSRTFVTEVDPTLYDSKGLSDKISVLKRNNRPFVVRGIARQWNVVRKWGDGDGLQRQAAKEEKAFPNRKYTVYKPENDGYLNQSHAAPFGCMTFHKYLVSAKQNNLYMLGVPDKSGRGASPFEMKKGDDTPPMFADDIDLDEGPKIFSDVFSGSIACRRHVFFNSAYSFTNLHYDTDWNTYLCVLGNRRWTIAHPGHARFLGASNGGASYSTLKPTKGIEGVSPNRLAHLIKFVRVDLSSGDVLCVPPTWWHVVEGLTNGFSCGINWFYTFPTLELGSPLDNGWEWMHPPSERMLVKSSSMSSTLTNVDKLMSPVDDEKEKLQPDSVGKDLQHVSDNGFVVNLCNEVRILYDSIPPQFETLVSNMHTGKRDEIIARQLGRIVVNSAINDDADIDCFCAISQSAVEMLDIRECHRLNTNGKRKRN